MKLAPVKAAAIFCAAVFLLPPVSAAAQDAPATEPAYTTYLTRKVIHNEPDTQPEAVFDCQDRIYAVLEAFHLPPQPVKLTVRWFNPSGEQQERTDFPFQGQPFNRVWAWLQLHGPTGAAIGQMFNPSFGMEEFIGDWEVRLFLDQQSVGKIPFQVVC